MAKYHQTPTVAAFVSKIDSITSLPAEFSTATEIVSL
jgi:hypothetical protein